MVFLLCVTGGSTLSYADTGSTDGAEMVLTAAQTEEQTAGASAAEDDTDGQDAAAISETAGGSVNAAGDEANTEDDADKEENKHTDSNYSEAETGANDGESADADSADLTDDTDTDAGDGGSAGGNGDSDAADGGSTGESTEATPDDSTGESTGAVADESTSENTAAIAGVSTGQDSDKSSVNEEESDDEDAAAEEELDAVSAADAGLTTYIWEDDEKVVTVCLSDPDALPEGAEFVVEDLTQEEYDECRELIIEQQFANDSDYGETEDERIAYAEAALQDMILYDMHFVYEGEEIEPDRNAMSVTIENKTAVDMETEKIVTAGGYVFIRDDESDATYTAIHIEENGKNETVVDVTDRIDTDVSGAVESVGLTVDSFSTIGWYTTAIYQSVKITNETLINDYGGSYTLEFILQNYNIFSSGDVVAQHTVGAVAVGGTSSFTSGIGINETHPVPSYFQGGFIEGGFVSYIGKNVMYLTGYDNNIDSWAYYYGGGYDIRFNDGGKGVIDSSVTHENGYFIDFDVAMAAIEAEMNSYVTSRNNIIVDTGNTDATLEKNHYTVEDNGTTVTVTLQSGYSYKFTDLDAIDYINVVTDTEHNENVNIISEEDGKVVLPKVLVNGQKPSGSESDYGCSLVFMLPNATTVDIGTKSNAIFLGHVVAPSAAVVSEIGGNTNGSFICASYNVPDMENHMWSYNGNLLVPDSHGFTAIKTLDGVAPTDSDDQFNFTLYEFDETTGKWEKVETAASAYGTGLVTFSDITYSSAADVGTHWYLISEDTGNTSKYTFDSTLYLAKVVVTSETTGTVNTTTTYTASAAYYKANADLTASELVKAETTTDEGVEVTTHTVDESKLESLSLSSENAETSEIFTFGNTTNKGSLKITKSVTVNGEATNTSEADGTYIFYVYNSSGEKVKTVYIKISGGQSNSETVSDLLPGKYTVTEDDSNFQNDMSLVGSNNIEVTVTAGDTAGIPTASFKNNINEKYTASGDLVLEVSKKLETDEPMMSLSEGQFEFKITQVDQSGNKVEGGYSETKSIDKDGKVTFEKTNAYSLDDVGKTYYYTVEEVIPDSKVNGFTYDTKLYTVAIYVSKDNGDGTLEIEKTYKYTDTANSVENKSATSLEFTNKYETKGAITLSAKKTLNYKTLPDQEFSFEIVEMSLNGGVLEEKIGGYTDTAANDENGSISFGAINYTQSGTYYYKITEQDGRISYYSYDSSYYIVTVKAEDNGKGELETKVTGVKHYSKDDTLVESYDDNTSDLMGTLVFTNDYVASGTLSLAAKKVLDTTGTALKDDQFTFQVTGYKINGDTRGTATARNSASGEVTFTNIVTYDQKDIGKTYYYTITEVNDAQSGYTYDETVYVAKVVVSDAGNGELSTDITYYKAEKAAESYKDSELTKADAVFQNSYATSGSVAFTATKTVEGRALKDQQFTFEITEVDARGTAVTSGYSGTVKNAADGTVSFLPEITYSQSGTYYYQIAEVNDQQKDYAYDARVYTAKVVVTDNGNGKLTTDISYTYSDGGSDAVQAQSVAFVNSYEGVVADFSFIKVNDQDPTQGIEGSEYGLYDADGDLITTVVSDENGLVSFDNLEVNVPYTIKELDPPAGSYVSPEEISFVIAYDDTTKVMSVEISDDGDGTLVTDDDGNYVWLEAQTIVSALKTDEDGNPLAGATLQIQDEDGNPVVIGTDENGEDITSWVTTSEAKRIASILDTGKVYYLVELEAPDGYEIADPIEFMIKDEAVAHDAEQVVELVMVDEKSTTTTTTTTTKTKKTTDTTEETTDTATEKTTESAATATASNTKTGDTSPIIPYTVMILAAIAVVAGVVIRRRRREKE
ncbi:MAG: hypothetical protein LUE31_01625 [Lachnospiraceae bacterium]|nr:hypothetical protein [Lachnospiraceae bacterium]